MTTKQTKTNRGGFAFAEFLVASTVASLMLSIFLPKCFATMDELAVGNAADEFVRVSQSARAMAIHYGRTAQVRIDENRIWVEVDTTRARTGELSTLGKVVDLADSGVSLDAPTSSLCYDSRGLALTRGSCGASGSRYEFSKGNSAQTVTSIATGFITE